MKCHVVECHHLPDFTGITDGEVSGHEAPIGVIAEVAREVFSTRVAIRNVEDDAMDPARVARAIVPGLEVANGRRVLGVHGVAHAPYADDAAS